MHHCWFRVLCRIFLQKVLAESIAMAAKKMGCCEERWGGKDTPHWKARGQVSMERTTMQRQHGVHRAFVVAAILDPRWKNFLLFEGFGVDDTSKENIQEEVVSLMVKGLSAINDKDGDELIEDNNGNNGVNNNDDDSIDSLDAISNARGTNMPTAELQQTSPEQHCRKEWDSYKNIRDVSRKANPLEWWHTHGDKFPILSVLAKRFLAVQATSASSERVFSHASRIMSHNRTRLHPDVAGQLLYVGMNIDWYEEQLKKHSGK